MSKSDAKEVRWPERPVPLPVPVYDNHTHLDLEKGMHVLEVADALERAEAAGVCGVIQVGTDVESSRWGADLAHTDARVLAAVAIHPNETPKYASDGTLQERIGQIYDLARQERVCAVGETGLDFFRTAEPDRAPQFTSFEAHIEIAKECGLALQIHDRDAHEDVVRTLKRVGAPERTVFHCFSGDAELAEICNENGWLLSFSGTVTFKNAPGIREALKVADPNLILVETDAPFLTPEPCRGKPNASYVMAHTVRHMAMVRGVELTEFCQLLRANTERVYGSW